MLVGDLLDDTYFAKPRMLIRLKDVWDKILANPNDMHDSIFLQGILHHISVICCSSVDFVIFKSFKRNSSFSSNFFTVVVSYSKNALELNLQISFQFTL
jgi:hypothetical protein